MRACLLALTVLLTNLWTIHSARFRVSNIRQPPQPAPAQCGGPLTGTSGNFASPNYPGNYPNNAYCVWTITVPQGSKFRIDFLFFETEPCYDLVKVFVGRRLVKRLTKGGGEEDNLHFKDDEGEDDDDDDDDDECEDDDDDDHRKDVDFAKGMYFAEHMNREKRQEPRIVSIHGTGEVVRVVFKSDPWVTRRGFFAHYSMGQALCGGPLVAPSGNFTSPGFPANYPNNVECRWTITVPMGSTLMLQFRTFETERCFDYLKITRGLREVEVLSGIYGQYLWFPRRLHDDWDDDCDDDDEDDDDDDDDDAKWEKKFRYGYRMSRFYGFPYLPRLYVIGNGEEISIEFKSDRIISLRGFDAVYRVLQGQMKGK